MPNALPLTRAEASANLNVAIDNLAQCGRNRAYYATEGLWEQADFWSEQQDEARDALDAARKAIQPFCMGL